MTSVLDIKGENGQIFLHPILEIENLSFPSPWSLKAFRAEIKRSISHLWAIMVDGVLSGYICFWMFDDEIQLLHLAVHPRKRGRGLGRYLLSRMIDTGNCNGIRSIWLEVRASNYTAKRLYDGLGFKEIHRRPRYYSDSREDAVVMSLGLSEKEVYPLVPNA